MSEFGSSPATPQPNENYLPAVTPESGGHLGVPLPAAPWIETTEKADGFNFTGFMNSLRRRWLAGLGFGLIFAAIVATLLCIVVPMKYEAFVTIRVRRNADEILRNVYKRPTHPQDFEIEKQTQAALLKSAFVIHAALRQPGISQMKLVRDEPWGGKRKNPVAWLERELKVQYAEGSEILKLSMYDRYQEDLKNLLNAITEAYMQEVVHAEAHDRTIKLQKLRDSYREGRMELSANLKKMSELASTYGSTKSENVQLRLDMGFKRLAALDRERMTVDQQFFEATDMYLLQQQKISSSMTYDPKSFEIEDVLSQYYPEYAAMKTRYIELDQMIKLGGGGRPGMGARGMHAQLAALRSQMEQYKQEKKTEVTERLRMLSDNDDGRNQEELQMMQTRLRTIQQRRQAIYEQHSKLSGELANMGQYSADLEAEEVSIRSQEEFLNQLKQEMETLQLEVASRPQIRILQSAIIPAEESNYMMRYLQVAAAAMMTMFLTVLGVAFWDMQGKRVNNSEDIMDLGDVRVIGSLPSLSGKRAGGLLPVSERLKQTVEVSLTRSIDSIRTALLFAQTGQPFQVVMVTSALGQEGKSTVASQLAVSFARSGRRTLLIDADIRNPQQHMVLGMPFQRGLCELLRSEATLDEVVQPTPAEGLWLLCAGQRNVDTDQVLASSLVANIFSELRSRFDMVIVDTGPALTCPDAMLLGQNVDTTVLAIRRDVSRLPKVSEACNRLRSVGIAIVGAVLNGASMDVRDGELQIDSTVGHDPQLEQSVSEAT